MTKTQNTQVLEHLRRHKTITALEALREYGCFRLAARIKELRDAGHKIQSCMTTEKGKRFALYYIGRQA